MDQNLLASGGVGAGIVVGLGIAYKIYQAINHHRIKSTCMGKEITASIDIDETNTTPKKNNDASVDVGTGTRNPPHSVGGTTRGQEVQEACT
jgi:hypothetical protein